VYLRWVDGPHASFVVLDQQITNEIKGEPAQLFQMGCHHFAFWVDDIDEMMERVRGAGIAVEELTHFPAPVGVTLDEVEDTLDAIRGENLTGWKG
jgi:diaminopimelate epimerase